ncbi:MAG: 50S ribosomal protein L29 [Candidatus Bathyarchaeota archaeon]|jgi:large subunit ribosomal protein L29
MRRIRELSPEERDSRLEELRAELSEVRTMINAGGSIENPGRVKALRKAIARLLTVNREEELGL